MRGESKLYRIRIHRLRNDHYISLYFNIIFFLLPLMCNCLNGSTKTGFLSTSFPANGCVAAFLIAPITADTKEPRFGLGVNSFKLCLELTGLDSTLLLLRL